MNECVEVLYCLSICLKAIYKAKWDESDIGRCCFRCHRTSTRNWTYLQSPYPVTEVALIHSHNSERAGMFHEINIHIENSKKIDGISVYVLKMYALKRVRQGTAQSRERNSKYHCLFAISNWGKWWKYAMYFSTNLIYN